MIGKIYPSRYSKNLINLKNGVFLRTKVNAALITEQTALFYLPSLVL